jgi:hypothetical protein
MKLGILFLFSFSLMAATETSCVYDAKASIDEDGDFRVGAFYVGIEGEKKTKRLTDSTSKIGCYKARLKCIPTGVTPPVSVIWPQFGLLVRLASPLSLARKYTLWRPRCTARQGGSYGSASWPWPMSF